MHIHFLFSLARYSIMFHTRPGKQALYGRLFPDLFNLATRTRAIDLAQTLFCLLGRLPIMMTEQWRWAVLVDAGHDKPCVGLHIGFVGCTFPGHCIVRSTLSVLDLLVDAFDVFLEVEPGDRRTNCQRVRPRLSARLTMLCVRHINEQFMDCNE